MPKYEIPTTEAALREWQPETPDTAEELSELVTGLVALNHDYGTCCYAMSLAAYAGFMFVARALGATGFQASCADMDLMRRTRGWKGPALILDGSNSLYPQYDLRGRVHEWLTSPEMLEWQRAEAQKKLDDPHSEHAHPNVLAHWRKLADRAPSPT